MLVDIPVLVAIDCHRPDWKAIGGAVQHRIITMRFDVDDDDAPAQFTLDHPAHEKSHWSIDKDGVLFALISSDRYRRLVERVRANPVDYCADQAEGLILQEEAEATRAASAQFGVGA